MALGKRQVECLERFKEPARFKPTSGWKPWPVMERLIQLGFMWVEERDRKHWNPNIDDWDWPKTEYWAGLSTDGIQALDAAQHGGGA